MRNFQTNIMENRVKLLDLLTRLKLEGNSIAGFGAPAKATTLLHYFGIGNDLLDYIVDDSPLKQGRYIPGKRIPIISSFSNPDYIFILAWNFADSIMERYPQYKGRFILPFPPRIV